MKDKIPGSGPKCIPSLPRAALVKSFLNVAIKKGVGYPTPSSREFNPISRYLFGHKLRHVKHRHLVLLENRTEFVVGVNHALVLAVLEFIFFDVRP